MVSLKRDHLFTYARLRQMLNNSFREADNTQLYLGYGGGGGGGALLPCLNSCSPKKKKLKALLYKTEQGRESRAVCVTDPNEMRSDVKAWSRAGVWFRMSTEAERFFFCYFYFFIG